MLFVACFGDNSDEQGPGNAPSITEIAGPVELDTGEETDFTITVRGQANEQLSVAVDATLGTFSPQTKVVITDEEGVGSFVTRYVSGSTAGPVTITANVSTLAANGQSSSKDLVLHEVERLGNVTSLNSPTMETANYLIAYPFTITGARTFTKFGIIAPQATNAQVGLYTSTNTVPSSRPLALITKLTANLALGKNELVVDPSALTAGEYWMVVTYEGTPMVHKNIEKTVAGWSIVGWLYSQELPSSFTGIMLEATPLSDRNFYLVLRK
jgi:hypothetical protein